MGFNPNIPQPTDNLSVSQGQFLTNNIALNTVFGVDHIDFTNVTAQKGFHKTIRQVIQPDPGPSSNNNIYAKSYLPPYSGSSADTQLFVQSSLGIISQLTGAAGFNDGWQWIGSVLLQWGRVTTPISNGTQSGSVTFQNRGSPAVGIPFPNNCFFVIPTGFFSSPTPSSEIGIAIKNSTLSKTKFDWTSNTDSSQYDGFYWIAVGN